MTSFNIRAIAPILLGGVLIFLPAINIYANATSIVQDKKPADDKKPETSPDEYNALNKMQKAKNTDALMKAAEEYMKKFPKGINRKQVPDFVIDKLIAVTDPTLKITYLKKYVEIFTASVDVNKANAALIESYFDAGKPDDAVSLNSLHLQKSPNDLVFLTSSADGAFRYWQKSGANTAPSATITEIIVNNSNKGVTLFEADKKPAAMSDEQWTKYRNLNLPQLYYIQAFSLNASGKATEARDAAEKAVGLESYNPYYLYLLFNITNREYVEIGEKYKNDRKSSTADQALIKLDETIDWAARFVAVSEGNAQLKVAHDQLMDILKQYYAYRHENKTDGLDDLIKKYKKPASN